MNISGDKLKIGMVYVELNWLYNKDNINLANVYLVLGITDKFAKSKYEDLKQDIQGSFVSKDSLLDTIDKVDVETIPLGSFYVDTNSTKFVVPKAYDTIKDNIAGILTLQLPYVTATTGIKHYSFNIIKELCVKESIMTNWMLKNKMIDKTFPTYVPFDDYKKNCLDIISVKDNDFNFDAGVSDAVKDIVSDNSTNLVKNFVKGQLIVRKTSKRARVLLVLGQKYGTTYLLEIYNEQKDVFMRSYNSYATHYIDSIKRAFKHHIGEAATQEYYDTGFNAYEMFKYEIEDKCSRC